MLGCVDFIDLRSDTVTRPCAAMRRAMAEAPVGDDVYGEDPTVARLQALAAERLGKEASLFFPSGTMANQACLRTHTRPGDVVLAPADCHILKAETGAAAALSGLQIKTLGSRGIVTGDDVAAGVHPRTSCITRARRSWRSRTPTTSRVARCSRPRRWKAPSPPRGASGWPLTSTAARLFNAAVASGVDAAILAAPFDTVSVCLSKDSALRSDRSWRRTGRRSRGCAERERC